jgi:hypothetical protein
MKRRQPPRYRYKPLSDPSSEIRLFTLFPGSNRCPLRCRLIEHSFPPQEPYLALSYEWDGPHRRCGILVNGRRALIPANLRNALRRLRARQPRDKSLVLWVDAICINQESIEEKNEQVQMMGQIFSKAEEVIAYLGEDDGQVKSLFRAVDACLGESCTSLNLPIEDEKVIDVTQKRLHELQTNAFQARHALESMSYWGRTWMVQEITLARSVSLLCGPSVLCSASTEILLTARYHSILSEIGGMYNIACSRTEFHGTGDAGDDKSHNDGYVNAVELLERHVSSSCHEPRDKLYALIGITPTNRMSLEVDYSISLEQLAFDLLVSQLPKDRGFHRVSAFDHTGIILAFFSSELASINTLSEKSQWVSTFRQRCEQVLLRPLSESSLRINVRVTGQVLVRQGSYLQVGDQPNPYKKYLCLELLHGEDIRTGDIVIDLQYTYLFLVYGWRDSHLALVGHAVYAEMSRYGAWAAKFAEQGYIDPYWAKVHEIMTRRELDPGSFGRTKSEIEEEEHARSVYARHKLTLANVAELEHKLQHNVGCDLQTRAFSYDIRVAVNISEFLTLLEARPSLLKSNFTQLNPRVRAMASSPSVAL